MRGHAAIARVLRAEDVRCVFGLTGDANMLYVADHIAQGGRFVGASSESGAVGMADGYHRVSGQLGVASVTHGPGATNTVTALTEAVRARTSLIIITGDPPPHSGHPQSIDLGAVFRPTGAGYIAVDEVDELASRFREAIDVSVSARLPVVVNIPAQVMQQELREGVPVIQRTARRPEPPPAAEDDLDKALGIVASAQRPTILAGHGAILSCAGESLHELADVLGAAVGTTARAKDLFDGHAANLGIIGSLGAPSGLEAFMAADCIVAFGASLNYFTTDHGRLMANKAIVQVDVEPSHLGRYMPATATVTGDARQVAAQMAARLLDLGLERRSFATSARRTLARSTASRPLDADTLNANTAMRQLDALLPAARTVIVDGGRFMVAPWRHLRVDEPGYFSHTLSFGSIGLSLATSIGAAIAAPDRLTVCVVGDGSLLMSLMEFSTAVRENVPLLVVAMNDSCYGSEYTKYRNYGYDPEPAKVAVPPLADVASALGGRATTVRRLQDLQTVKELVDPSDGRPALMNVILDPAHDPREP